MKTTHRIMKYGKGYTLRLSYVDNGKSKLVTITLKKGAGK